MVDPVMQQVLKECQETPGSLAKHLRDPGIATKLQKLMGAGMLRWLVIQRSVCQMAAKFLPFDSYDVIERIV
jgi:hypothetical protein